MRAVKKDGGAPAKRKVAGKDSPSDSLGVSEDFARSEAGDSFEEASSSSSRISTVVMQDSAADSLAASTRRRQEHRCLFLPSHFLKQIWDFAVLCLVLFTAVVLPVRIAFEEKASPEWKRADNAIDVIFICDILVSFNSAVEDDDAGAAG